MLERASLVYNDYLGILNECYLDQHANTFLAFRYLETILNFCCILQGQVEHI